LKDHENEKKRKKEKKKEKKKQLTTNPQRKYVVSTRKLDFFFPFMTRELLLFGSGKNQGVFATNKKLPPNPILPN
jgi:hypothetical protein